MRLPHRLLRWWMRAVPIPWGKGLLARAVGGVFGPAEVATVFGMRMRADPRETIGRELFLTGEWEPHTTAAFREHLRPGDVVVDAGANAGYHALLASSLVGEGGVVLAFEPEPASRTLLEEHLLRNGVRNCRVYPVGLAEAPGSVVLHRGPSWNPGAGSLRPQPGSAGEVRITVARGDALVPRDLRARVRLVKVDVEGAEMGVLRGLGDLVGPAGAPYLVVEVTDEFLRDLGESEEGLLAYLHDRGYSMLRLSEPPAAGRRQYDALFYRSTTS